MNFSQKQIIIIGAGAFLLIGIIALVFFNLQPSKVGKTQLTVWGFDKSSAVGGIIAAYKQLQPNIGVSYIQVSKDNYENTLLNALASEQGPDIFPIHNRGISKKVGILYPAASSQITSARVQDLFPAEVEQDFAVRFAGSSADQIYALPLYFDTLSLIYNKDLFDQGGIISPPTTWEEFQADVAKLRNVSSNGQITRAGAAIGGSQKTITNAVDILNVLMLQNGAFRSLEQNGMSFSSESGLNAFNFYLQFANPSSNYYTWNDSQQNDFDSFSSGNTAMAFAYSSDIEKIKSKSPFLRLGIAPLPQINPGNVVNYADYWGLAVSKQSRNPALAWDFISTMATNAQIAGEYLKATGQPPALRQIINQKIDDQNIGVFAKQALTARSWQQPDENQTESIFNNAIASVLGSQSNSQKALSQAQEQITKLMTQQ